MSTSPCKTLLRLGKTALRVTLTLGLLSSCLDAPDPIMGTDLAETKLVVTHADMGVHPNADVLVNPHNPFRYSGVGEETKWELLTYANRSAAFYAWATLLAQQPRGELQFYTAQIAHTIYRNNEVPESELDSVRAIALGGYQAVLDHFPDGLTYDVTGTVAYRVATLAYQGIIDLGEVPSGGWVLVTTESGAKAAIQLPREDRTYDE